MGYPAAALFFVAEFGDRASDHVMYGEANRCGHFALGQFFVDHCSSEATEGTTTILFRCGHAHQAKVGHLVVDFSREVVLFVPCFGMGSNSLLGEATDGVANLGLLFVEVK